MHGKIVPNWMWEYTINCVNYLLILLQFILVIIVTMAINARMTNTLFPDVYGFHKGDLGLICICNRRHGQLGQWLQDYPASNIQQIRSCQKHLQ